MAKYQMTLTDEINDTITYLSVKMDISKAQVISRALALLKVSADAAKVTLTLVDGTEQNVRLK